MLLSYFIAKINKLAKTIHRKYCDYYSKYAISLFDNLFHITSL